MNNHLPNHPILFILFCTFLTASCQEDIQKQSNAQQKSDPASGATPGKIAKVDSLTMPLDSLGQRRADSLARVQRKQDSLKKKYGIAMHPEEYYLERVPFKDTTENAVPSECSKNNCAVWADIHKTNQMLYLYLSGQLVDSFKVSTGKKGHTTPDLDRRPSGPVYNKYSSRKFPGGNYKGLGNMPYAIFIQGGIAIHGTTNGNFGRLGNIASHGCIRMHPDNGKIFNALVRKTGLGNVWVTVGE